MGMLMESLLHCRNVNGPETWRGQAFREGSNRYCNRGGNNREFYRLLHAARSTQPGAVNRCNTAVSTASATQRFQPLLQDMVAPARIGAEISVVAPAAGRGPLDTARPAAVAVSTASATQRCPPLLHHNGVHRCCNTEVSTASATQRFCR